MAMNMTIVHSSKQLQQILKDDRKQNKLMYALTNRTTVLKC